MAKKRMPSFKFTLRTGEGATLSGSGPCTEKEVYAIYMIGLAAKADTKVGEALRAYLDACEEALAAAKVVPTVPA